MGTSSYYSRHKIQVLEKMKKYYLLKKPDILQRQKDYYAKHKRAVIRRARKNYRANPDAKKARNKAYYILNKDKISEQAKSYHLKHPEVARKSWHRRRALKRNASIGDSKVISSWEKRWKTKLYATCYWCRKPTRVKDCHTDHMVPLSKRGPHAIENLCIACSSCNNTKRASLLSEWNNRISEPVLL